MKIAYVLNTYPAPSHSFIRREVRALERRGEKVERIAMRPFDGELIDPGDQEEAAKTTYVLSRGVLALVVAIFSGGIQKPARMWRAFFLMLKVGRGSEAGLLKHLIYFLEAAYVAKEVTVRRVDRMHAHFGTNSTTVAMLASQMTGVPFSFTVHGPEEFDKPGAIALKTKIEKADFTVAISSFGRSQLCRLVDYRHWPSIQVVHCGIETEHYDTRRPAPTTKPITLVNIGRFSEQKGQLILINAMAEVAKRGVDVRLSLVGDGELRRPLEQVIKREGLGDRITLTGWLDEQGVREQIENAHALVLPSFAEGLPMVVMEAMIASRPVIATWIAGVPELMVPGKTGWLVPAGSVGRLADAIIELAASSDDELRRMGTMGRARVLNRHDIEKEAEKLAGHFAQRPRTHPS